MKAPTIRIVGKHITDNNFELEDGYVEIELEVKDLLDEIDGEDIGDYAENNLDMKHEDDFESSLDDFTDDDLVEKLQDWGYNFSKQIDEDECIEFLEDSGYIVITEQEAINDTLDYADAVMMREIQEKFLNGSWNERITLYNKIFNL